MPYQGNANEGPAVRGAACQMRTVLDVFPKAQGLLDFRRVLEAAVLY